MKYGEEMIGQSIEFSGSRRKLSQKEPKSVVVCGVCGKINQCADSTTSKYYILPSNMLKFKTMKPIFTWLVICGFSFISFSYCPPFLNKNNIFWGFSAHQRINKMAVFTLPEEMLPLYKKEIIYLTEHAVDADKRRYISSGEGFNHFWDFEFNGKLNYNYLKAIFENASIYCFDSLGNQLLLSDKKSLHHRKADYYFTAPAVKYIFGRDSVVIADSFLRAFSAYLIRLPRAHDSLFISPDSLFSVFIKENLRPKAAISKIFAIDTVYKHGMLPYAILRTYQQLVNAFLKADKKRILKFSADIGHYVADAHVPLHTTHNYNGQLTQQEGIHAFWETRLPEIYSENQYTYFVGNANFIQNTTDYIFKIIAESHADVKRVLFEEKILSQKYPPDKKYVFLSQKNAPPQRVWSVPYTDAYHTALNGMVEARMQKSIHAVGNLWYSAWVEAGKPNLKNLPAQPISKAMNSNYSDMDFNEEARQLFIADSLFNNNKKMLGRSE